MLGRLIENQHNTWINTCTHEQKKIRKRYCSMHSHTHTPTHTHTHTHTHTLNDTLKNILSIRIMTTNK